MKTQISTSIEQSRRLLSCGVDPKTADMVWLNRGQYPAFLSFNEGCNRAIPEVGDVPAWSLSALLELLPPQFKPSWPEFDFCLQLRRTTNGKWGIAYDHTFEADSPIEACVKMFETLAELCYPLNKIEE